MDLKILIWLIVGLIVGVIGTWLAMRKNANKYPPIDANNDIEDIASPLSESCDKEEKNLANSQINNNTVENAEKNLNEKELRELKEKCSELEKEIVDKVTKKEAELRKEFEKILEEVKSENVSLSKALKLAEEGHIDENLKIRLQESEDSIKKLSKKIESLSNELEEAEEEQEELEKKLKNEKQHHQKTTEELEKSDRDKKRLAEDIKRIELELSHNLEQLNKKNKSLDFVKEILSAKESNASDVKSLYRAIDFFEAFLRGQFMDCNAYLYNTYDGLSFNDICGRPGFVEKKKVFLQMFDEWASVKRKSWLDQKTTIAFVGEFSAGKTSIVNRILSQDNPNIPLLPVSTKATTAIPTYIAGGVLETYNFVTPDDKFKNIDEKVFKMVSKEVLDEIKGVSSLIKYFVMTYKNPNLNGLSILDTPGFNSNDEEDKKRTIEVINECDILFWLVDVNNGTVNRSSISRIKEDLRKPIVLVINKVDTKPKSEVDGVEQLIKKTFAEEGVNIERIIKFSSKSPLSDIMNPIKAVKHDSSRDSFIDIVGNDLTQLSSILDNGVKEANKEHQKMKKVSSKLDKDFYSILQNLANDCADASNIPQWVEHFFSSDRYEMSGEEGGRLKDLLEDSVTKCQYLSDIYNKETDAIANVQQAYSDLIDLKMSWQKIDDCLKEFKKVSKPFL